MQGPHTAAVLSGGLCGSVLENIDAMDLQGCDNTSPSTKWELQQQHKRKSYKVQRAETKCEDKDM